MKNLIMLIKFYSVSLIVVFLVFAFCLAEINPFKWEESQRVFMVICFFFGTAFLTLIIQTVDLKK
jgi:hypothetical protein